ncbi:putative alkylated DNA repair protein [Janibacter sp. HTCC2649]|uniref:alpha-ketoglutarate-dependent dioxygenase AlkB n=1 Tax=Janibacter sp. HTCC2649 TaxID=313589 RepID=UPI000066EC69|nr:alpha-ketoglutarate-dependent dioxygenase AlkB [Janibacter sp. HTCC2649]EAP99476.1 putative alkylated DNA repair protein [Janibacter sp. HTCC2649]
MAAALQHSLFDTGDAIDLGALAPNRTILSRGAWVDYQPSWLTGADLLFDTLHDDVPWKAERREMYERIVDVPRLLKFYEEGEVLPHPVLMQARKTLSDTYAGELGEPFVTAGMCLYRDGRDSVAWHGDRIGRAKDQDTMVAILSVGSARSLMLRPRGGGSSLGFSLGHGDLVVMGGSCQRTWDHAIPKTSKPVGPRISIQFRPRGIR